MKIKIRSGYIRLTIPVPGAVIGLAARWVPDRALKEMDHIAEPYRSLIAKELLPLMLGECQSMVKEHKGLEIIHVETVDGTLVSVKL